jgi:hypothetical protein
MAYKASKAFSWIGEPSSDQSPFVKALLESGICPPECTKLTITVELNKPIRVVAETFLNTDLANTEEVIRGIHSLSGRLRPTLLPPTPTE